MPGPRALNPNEARTDDRSPHLAPARFLGRRRPGVKRRRGRGLLGRCACRRMRKRRHRPVGATPPRPPDRAWPTDSALPPTRHTFAGDRAPCRPDLSARRRARGRVRVATLGTADPREAVVEQPAVEVTAERNYRAPMSWDLMVQDAGNRWAPVVTSDPYGLELNQYNVVRFRPVETPAIRMNVKLPPGDSAGILAWKVF